MFNSKKLPPATTYDLRAADLVARYDRCDVGVCSIEVEGMRYQAAPRAVRYLFHAVGQMLGQTGEEYRRGESVDLYLKCTDEMLQLVEGLLGYGSDDKFGQVGADLFNLELRLRDLLKPADPAGSTLPPSHQLALDCYNGALEKLQNCLRGKAGFFQYVEPEALACASRAVANATEALEPKSSGVSFVARLDPFKRRIGFHEPRSEDCVIGFIKRTSTGR